MTQTIFPTTLNNFSTTIGAAYVEGSGSLRLATGAGTALALALAAAGLPAVSVTHPVRLGVGTSDAAAFVFSATSVTGDALDGAAVEGADQSFSSLTLTLVRANDTAGLVRLREGAINALEATVGALPGVSPGTGWVPAPTTGDQVVAIQAAVDAPAAGPAAVRFPAGSWPLGTPVYLDRSDLDVEGMGEGATNVGGGDYAGGGGFVVGLRRVYNDGRHIGPEHRPDCHGVLDSGAAPSAGVRKGLSTQGNICGVLVARDRMETWAGLSIQLAVNTLALTGGGQALAGFDPTRGRGPFFVGTHTDPTVWKVMVWWADGTMTEVHVEGVPQAALVRVRVWLDFASGARGATVNGAAATTNLNGGPSFAGKVLLANRTNLAFMLGVADWVAPAGGGTPDFTLYGFRVSKVAVTSEPATDLARYFDESINDMLLLPFDDVTPARHLKVALAGGRNSMFLPHSDGLDLPPVVNVSVAGLSMGGVENGILFGAFQRARVRKGSFLCGSNGWASLPLYFSEAFTASDCIVSGGQAGFSFAQIVRMSLVAVDVKDGGPYTQATFRGCSVDWSPSMLFEPSGAETYVDLWNGDYGGVYRIAGMLSDSEGAGISVAGIRAETHAQCQTDLQLEQVTFGTLGPTATAILLIGHTGSGIPPQGSAIRANGLLSGDATSAGAVLCVGAGWYGEIDGRGLASNAKLGGSDAGLVTVRTS